VPIYILGVSLGESLCLYKTIVAQVLLSHPLEPLLFVGVQRLLCGEVRRIGSSYELVKGWKKEVFSQVDLQKTTSIFPVT
jgi:hypothetical protein